ncbi:MAG: hypothetical protein ROZ09_03775 [Thiobacillus sp.]|jgi:hypothetical protein|uniref:hypothetical protein n=1 Tax=Thiobacillus sp. TaxID=924 RepID=UPI0028943DC9|nr:hypothetical protein [Thiobacillus sp.]MDT3705922.1 hypothetical protein [Thiobacillus sp.]
MFMDMNVFTQRRKKGYTPWITGQKNSPAHRRQRGARGFGAPQLFSRRHVKVDCKLPRDLAHPRPLESGRVVTPASGAYMPIAGVGLAGLADQDWGSASRNASLPTITVR